MIPNQVERLNRAIADDVRDGQFLPLSGLLADVGRDRFDEAGLRETIEAYDARRARVQPYAKQRDEGEFGTAAPYTWSENKTRQYTKPARAGFGAFIRAKGFCLE